MSTRSDDEGTVVHVTRLAWSHGNSGDSTLPPTELLMPIERHWSLRWQADEEGSCPAAANA